MKIYLSGPITGLPEKNRPAFKEAENILLSQGHEVFNPFQLDLILPPTASWEDNMRHCIAELSKHQNICLLPGWDKSKGARLEALIAAQMGFKIYKLVGENLVREHLIIAECLIESLT